MITKGKSTTGRGLAAHLSKKNNDRVEVLDIRGAAIENLQEAIDDWRDLSKGTTCNKPIYHAQLNPDRDLSREEWDKAIGIFEKEMGLEGYPRAVVLHEKEGREHVHLVYSRFNHDLENERLTAWSDSWNYPKHERASREIERELGLEKTQGVFVDREGERAERTPSHDEMQQGDRLKIDPREVKAEVSALYKSADSGRAFVAALESEGYTLARGDQRSYVILDEVGGVHSLARVAGVKVAELRETLQDYPLHDLPSVAEAREQVQERAQRPEQEQGLVAAPSSHFAYTLGDSAQVTRLNPDNPAPQMAGIDQPAGEIQAEGAGLEHQAFADQLGTGTLEQNDSGIVDGDKADAPTLDQGVDPDSEGMHLGVGAINAITDGVIDILGGLFEGFAGGGKPPPTPEQQKATNERKEQQAYKNDLKRYEEEHAQKNEQEKGKEKDSGLGLDLDLYRRK
jgi:hypothetical protein